MVILLMVLELYRKTWFYFWDLFMVSSEYIEICYQIIGLHNAAVILVMPGTDGSKNIQKNSIKQCC